MIIGEHVYSGVRDISSFDKPTGNFKHILITNWTWFPAESNTFCLDNQWVLVYSNILNIISIEADKYNIFKHNIYLGTI